MKIKLPTLRTLVQDAHKNGAVANRFRVTEQETAEIRRAEARGGHQAGLVVVFRLLSGPNKVSEENIDFSKLREETRILRGRRTPNAVRSLWVSWG
jgi:hypothetical protein